MREPSLNEKSAIFLKFILPKFLENSNYASPPRPAFGGATPQQNFLLRFLFLRAPIFFFQLRKKKILLRYSALLGRGGSGCITFQNRYSYSARYDERALTFYCGGGYKVVDIVP